jgi:hypothetical protein
VVVRGVQTALLEPTVHQILVEVEVEVATMVVEQYQALVDLVLSYCPTQPATTSPWEQA